MKWKLSVAGLVLALLAYTIWPLVGLYQLASAVERRDVTALDRLVDFPVLRRDISVQIIESYLKLTGQSVNRTAFENRLAVGIGSTLADPEVEKIINPQGLIDLLGRGRVSLESSGEALQSAPALPRFALSQAFRFWLESDYGVLRVFFRLPPGVRTSDQYRIRLVARGGLWRLTGVELPEAMRMRLAQEVLKRNPRS